LPSILSKGTYPSESLWDAFPLKGPLAKCQISSFFSKINGIVDDKLPYLQRGGCPLHVLQKCCAKNIRGEIAMKIDILKNGKKTLILQNQFN
jgi:hypothetical protein